MMMVRKSKGLSERHISVLEFLVKYQDENGRPPSIREIGDAAKISSTSVVNYYLDQLEKMGYIERDGRVSRGVRLNDKVNEVVQMVTDLMRVPVLGRIVASEPVPDVSSPANLSRYRHRTSTTTTPIQALKSPLPCCQIPRKANSFLLSKCKVNL